MTNNCRSCDTPWDQHSGPVEMCRKIERMTKEIEQLQADLDRTRAELASAVVEIHNLHSEAAHDIGLFVNGPFAP